MQILKLNPYIWDCWWESEARKQTAKYWN